MEGNVFYRARLRNKGQITVPSEIREQLAAAEGDDLLFYTDEQGRIILSRAQLVPPEQAWFWTKRWQHMEHEAQEDIAAGRVVEFDSIKSALAFLEEIPPESDAED